MRIEEAQGLWSPEGVYLNTASFGLPPRPAWEALQSALADWRGGRTSWEDWDRMADSARNAFARMVAVPPETVSTGPNVSSLVGIVAASLPDGARVLSTENEFTSALWPFLAQAGRGVEVDCVATGALAEAISPAADVVAFSAVQSSDGYVADLEQVAAAARASGAITVVDATQACGWLPLDASLFDVLVCHAYKWLLSPRGTAFMYVRPEVGERLVPTGAGWHAAEDPYGAFYGPPLRLAPDARRFDVSPAWFSWVGTAPALETLLEIGIEQIREHDVRLANRFRAGLGLEPSNSAIVSAELPGVEERLDGTGVMAAARAGGLRTAWHVYNTDEDVDRVLELLGR